ncbi:hypothetical protein Tco_1116751 [Tanacetum coccineum]
MIDAEAEAVHIILTEIDSDIYSTIDTCPNAKEMWKEIEHLMQGENINKHDVETNLFCAFEWQRFVTIVKQGQDLKIVSYHKLFDIMKQHQNEVNKICAERLSRNANPLALVASTQQQLVYYPQEKPSYLPETSSLTRSHATTRSKGKEIAKAHSQPSESEHEAVSGEEETQRDKDIQSNGSHFKNVQEYLQTQQQQP